MLLRAIFWIAVVAVLIPHEPDLGLGRPNADSSRAAPVRGVSDVRAEQAGVDCKDYAAACNVAFGYLDSFQSLAVKGLAQVKADIEEEQRSRMHRGIDARAD